MEKLFKTILNKSKASRFFTTLLMFILSLMFLFVLFSQLNKGGFNANRPFDNKSDAMRYWDSTDFEI